MFKFYYVHDLHYQKITIDVLKNFSKINGRSSFTLDIMYKYC